MQEIFKEATYKILDLKEYAAMLEEYLRCAAIPKSHNRDYMRFGLCNFGYCHGYSRSYEMWQDICHGDYGANIQKICLEFEDWKNSTYETVHGPIKQRIETTNLLIAEINSILDSLN